MTHFETVLVRLHGPTPDSDSMAVGLIRDPRRYVGYAPIQAALLTERSSAALGDRAGR